MKWLTSPEICSETCDQHCGPALPRVTQVGSPSGIWRAALPRARASRERITFSTGSLLKDSEKRRAVCTRPTLGLPTGPSAPQHRPGGQSHRKPRASPKESCKIPNGWHRHRRQPLKWRFSKVTGCPRNQEPIWPQASCITTLFQASVSPSINKEALFLYTFYELMVCSNLK